MKIQIKQLTKKGIITSLINRASLKNYIFFEKLKNKNIWIKPDYYQELISQVKKKVSRKATAKYRLDKGTTEFMKKKYIRFRFALWRFKLTDVQRIKFLFKKLEKKYQLVKSQGKKFPTQRIGITFAAQEKEFNTFTNSKTKRKNTTEVYDFISTATYANNDPSTIGMFDELLEKTLQYYMKTGKSPSMLEDDSIKTAKHFYVFFVEA